MVYLHTLTKPSKHKWGVSRAILYSLIAVLNVLFLVYCESIKMDMHLSLLHADFHSSGCIPRNGTARLHRSSIFSFLRIFYTCDHIGCVNYLHSLSPTMIKVSGTGVTGRSSKGAKVHQRLNWLLKY